MNFVNQVKAFAKGNKLAIGRIQYPIESVMATKAICAHVKDGKGIIYCHISGKYQGKVFYVPLGIGWFYKKVLKGSQSQIGLPISKESKMSQEINKTQIQFEAGVIEYDLITSTCKAFKTGPDFKIEFKEMVL